MQTSLTWPSEKDKTNKARYFVVKYFYLDSFGLAIIELIVYCLLILAGIMFQDITTLLLDPKTFKDTIDLFVERYKSMDISVVAGNLYWACQLFCVFSWLIQCL